MDSMHILALPFFCLISLALEEGLFICGVSSSVHVVKRSSLSHSCRHLECDLLQRLWGFYSFKMPASGWYGSFRSPLLLVLVLETDDTLDLGFFHSSIQSAHLNKLHFYLTLDSHVDGTFDLVGS